MLKQLLLALKRLLRALGPVLVGCIFLGAVYLLYREISKYSLADIRMSLAQISTGSIILSVLLAIINYIILIGYDWLADKFRRITAQRLTGPQQETLIQLLHGDNWTVRQLVSRVNAALL